MSMKNTSVAPKTFGATNQQPKPLVARSTRDEPRSRLRESAFAKPAMADKATADKPSPAALRFHLSHRCFADCSHQNSGQPGIKGVTHVNRIIILLALAVSYQLSAFAQGPLTPPGAPAPSMLTLSQVEPRTPITNTTAVTISTPGSYYLTANITVGTGDGIDINVDGVTLDLNGFTISSTAATPNGTAILLNGGNTDITILNGHILGTSFASGINYSGTAPVNARVSGVSVSSSAYGIMLGTASPTVVDYCTVQSIGVYGIQASSVSHSSAYLCGSAAINANTAETCYGNCTGSGDGFYVGTANNCYGYSSSGYGLYATTATGCYGLTDTGTAGLDANNAINCYGVSNGSNPGLLATTASNCQGQNNASGDGLDATTANNCQGACAGLGTGLSATETATGCYGFSADFVGLMASNAENCNGKSSNGEGLTATMANNCYGASYGSGSSPGLEASNAENCQGISYGNGTGLEAITANNCQGLSSGNGTGLLAYNANNCYGNTSSGWGLYVYQVATGCYGFSSTGPALFAANANFCFGSGTAVVVAGNWYNMPTPTP
jgi:hypothetical protein